MKALITLLLHALWMKNRQSRVAHDYLLHMMGGRINRVI
ncbi:hypothetical protein A4U88_3891 [Serratia marcescens]|nr:hypothetical protein A4U88_3891 [Serratia marcescens]